MKQKIVDAFGNRTQCDALGAIMRMRIASLYVYTQCVIPALILVEC